MRSWPTGAATVCSSAPCRFRPTTSAVRRMTAPCMPRPSFSRSCARAGVLEPEGASARRRQPPPPAPSCNSVWPWLATRRSADLPETLEPPDGVLAGLIAATRSRAARSVPWPARACRRCLPPRRRQPGASAPTARRRAGRASVPDRAAARRLDAAVRRHHFAGSGMAPRRRQPADGERAARRAPGRRGGAVRAERTALWTRLRRIDRGPADRLSGARAALRGASTAEAFDVRCDRSTMSQNDLDNGRVIAQISVAAGGRGRAHHGRARARRRRRGG